MACQRVPMPGGGHAIVCGPRQKAKRCACGRRADRLCDWKLPAPAPADEAIGHKTPTCDAPICSHCTTEPAPGKDLCREHGEAWAVWKLRKGVA